MASQCAAVASKSREKLNASQRGGGPCAHIHRLIMLADMASAHWCTKCAEGCESLRTSRTGPVHRVRRRRSTPPRARRRRPSTRRFRIALIATDSPISIFRIQMETFESVTVIAKFPVTVKSCMSRGTAAVPVSRLATRQVYVGSDKRLSRAPRAPPHPRTHTVRTHAPCPTRLRRGACCSRQGRRGETSAWRAILGVHISAPRA